MTYSLILPFAAVLYLAVMTYICYSLGLSKTEDAKKTAIIGLFLAIIPPFVLIYIIVLMFKEDTDIV